MIQLLSRMRNLFSLSSICRLFVRLWAAVRFSSRVGGFIARFCLVFASGWVNGIECGFAGAVWSRWRCREVFAVIWRSRYSVWGVSWNLPWLMCWFGRAGSWFRLEEGFRVFKLVYHDSLITSITVTRSSVGVVFAVKLIVAFAIVWVAFALWSIMVDLFRRSGYLFTIFMFELIIKSWIRDLIAFLGAFTSVIGLDHHHSPAGSRTALKSKVCGLHSRASPSYNWLNL